MQGTKWDGLLPISSYGSRHSRWCHDKNGVGCTTGSPVRMTECLRALKLDRKGAVATDLLEFSIATENSLS